MTEVVSAPTTLTMSKTRKAAATKRFRIVAGERKFILYAPTDKLALQRYKDAQESGAIVYTPVGPVPLKSLGEADGVWELPPTNKGKVLVDK